MALKQVTFSIGEGTNSATPLAWTHAEYIKLVKSLTDKKIWDSYGIVKERYSCNKHLSATRPKMDQIVKN